MRGLKKKFGVMVCVIGMTVFLFVTLPLLPGWQRAVQKVPDRIIAGYETHAYRSRSLEKIELRRVEMQKYANMTKGKSKSRRLPDVVGIGVEKCGTDAVISFLRLHPFVITPKDGEVESQFFNSNKYAKGLDYYKSLLPMAADHELIMEKTPSYFDSPPRDVPNRIHKDLPNAKLILILCEPVKRSFSDYTQEKVIDQLWNARVVTRFPTFDSYLDVYLNRVKAMVSDLKEKALTRTFSSYNSDQASAILTTGFCSLHLPRWTELFDTKHLLIIDGENMLNDPGAQIERMQEFLGLPKLILASDFVRSPVTGLFCVRPWWKNYDFESEWENKLGWHKNLFCLGGTKGRTRHSNGHLNVSEKHLAELQELYRPFNRDLFAMTGIDYRQ